jgi:4-amino-4-deoxychorismate lyase
VTAHPAIWIDGEPAEALPLPDRGLDFGDGLFETLLVWRGRPLFPELHLQRLGAGLQALSFPDCVDAVGRQLETVAAFVTDREWTALRLTVTRGAGPRGYTPPHEVRPRIIISASTLTHDCATMASPAHVQLGTVRWPTQPLLAGLKHLNRLEQVLAASEARSLACDETVMLDQQGNVISVAAGNLFLLVEGRLLTPLLDDCGIAGTRRRLLLEQWAPALGLPVEQTRVSVQQMLSAEEVFYSNSLLGLRPVASLGERHWHKHPVCQALHRCYLETLPC